MKQQTAILIFARTASAEMQHKAIYGSNPLFDALNAHTLNTVTKTGIPYFVSDETRQEGNTFGQRFVHAISQVFAAGYERVIVIGNDTPHLHTAHIVKAATALNNQSLVLGPSTDGGFYLLGLNRTAFNQDMLLSLPWQSQQLTTTLLSQHKISGDIALLPQLADIDSWEDIRTIRKFLFTLSRKANKHLQQLIQTLISITEIELNRYQYYQPNTRAVYLQIPSNKGSPAPYNL